MKRNDDIIQFRSRKVPVIQHESMILTFPLQ